MLTTVFYFVLNMSLASCLVIVALLGIRAVKPLPRRWVYPLWGLAFFRLMMPFTLPTDWSLFNLTGSLVKRLVTIETVIPVPRPTWNLTAMNWIGAAEQYAPLVFKTESLRQVFSVAALVWIIVAVAGLATAVILYVLTRAELNKAQLIEGNLYHADTVTSPVLIGLIRPKIILPSSLDPDSAEGRMVLAHEQVHLHRRDNLWRLLAIGLACLHWFNPLAWVMLRAFFTDMELATDELVVKKFAPAQRRSYAKALLRFSDTKPTLVSAGFGHSGVRVRVTNVLNYRRLTLIGAIASAGFLALVTLVLLTNPGLRG
ncbi:MAG: M56 family metallopeptidase [Propionibacteriaceae bacterium]|nr:M56 family metallopeptidase [Propionibacteriaceae bacterium]